MKPTFITKEDSLRGYKNCKLANDYKSNIS